MGITPKDYLKLKKKMFAKFWLGTKREGWTEILRTAQA